MASPVVPISPGVGAQPAGSPARLGPVGRAAAAARLDGVGRPVHVFDSAARRRDAPPDLQFYVGRGLDVVDPFVTLTVAMTQPASRGRSRCDRPIRWPLPIIMPELLQRGATTWSAWSKACGWRRRWRTRAAYDALRGAASPIRDGSVRTASDIRAFIRRTADTIFHPVGTCRMGTRRDAVVDPQLRVRGVDGLRVADASVLPVTLNSQIHAACVMIGESAQSF